MVHQQFLPWRFIQAPLVKGQPQSRPFVTIHSSESGRSSSEVESRFNGGLGCDVSTTHHSFAVQAKLWELELPVSMKKLIGKWI